MGEFYRGPKRYDTETFVMEEKVTSMRRKLHNAKRSIDLELKRIVKLRKDTDMLEEWFVENAPELLTDDETIGETAVRLLDFYIKGPNA